MPIGTAAPARSRRRRAPKIALFFGTAVSAGLVASAALAQQQGAPNPPAAEQEAQPAGPSAPPAVNQPRPGSATVSEVVVTGSRIHGVPPVGSDMINISRQDIVTAGPATTANILRTLPQVQGLGPNATATSAQNGAANVTRSSGLNLRGIGVDATLVLLDGQRLPPAGTQGQLVDPSVIPAIALQRIEVVADGASAIYGSDAVAGVVNLITRQNFEGLEAMARYGSAADYNEYQFSAIAGHRWTGGSVTVAYEHDHNSDLFGASRPFYTTYLTPFGGRDLRSNQCNPGNIVAGGVSYAIPPGGVTPATAGSLTPRTTNLCDNVKSQDIIPELTRDSVLVNAHQDLNDWISAFAEGYFSRRTGLNIANNRTASLVVPRSNAFFVAPPGFTGPSETVTYNFGPVLGLNHIPLLSESYDLVGGFNIKLPADWKAQVSGSFGRSDDLSDTTTNLNTPAINAALASSDPNTALNVFGGPTNPATLASISNGYFRIKARTGLATANIQADGPVFQLPGGDVRLAVGGEYRYEELTGDLINGSAVAPHSTFDTIDRDVIAGYGELFVPIVGSANAMPLVQRLDLSIAGRIERYSDFGETSNPKIGVTWAPTEDLKIRASYGTSFRAPSLSQSDPHSSGFGLYADTLPNPQGVPVYGIGIAGGNPGLKPETATTYSVGGDWTPAFAPGLRASLTYFDVNYVNQIVTLRGTPGLTSLPTYARYVIWNPTPAQIAQVLAQYPQNQPINASQVTFIADGRAQNLGATHYQGFDFDVSYRWTWLIGNFEAGVNGTYFTKLNTAVAPGAPVFDAADLINYPQRLRARFNLAWNRGGWQAVAYANYIDSYTNNTVTPAQKISSYTTIDTYLGYTFPEDAGFAPLRGITLSLQAQNLFDQQPPFVNISPGYDAQSANPIGRLISVSIDKKF